MSKRLLINCTRDKTSIILFNLGSANRARTVEAWPSGVNFINVLGEAFTRVDLESAKTQSSCRSFLHCICACTSPELNVDEIEPRSPFSFSCTTCPSGSSSPSRSRRFVPVSSRPTFTALCPGLSFGGSPYLWPYSSGEHK